MEPGLDVASALCVLYPEWGCGSRRPGEARSQAYTDSCVFQKVVFISPTQGPISLRRCDDFGIREYQMRIC